MTMAMTNMAMSTAAKPYLNVHFLSIPFSSASVDGRKRIKTYIFENSFNVFERSFQQPLIMPTLMAFA
jgi:hypothetical protein